MLTPSALLARLTDIGRSLERSGHALALIGLGSVGLELERLDAYSDLDFFAIVEDGYKSRYLDNLDWLSSLCPVAYHFRNTPDGYKLLFHDGIFCEFAVFEPGELSAMLFTHGRIIWKRPQIEETIGAPTVRPASTPPPEADWLVNEALTNLYVGLGRFRRGERLSAARFIQHYAVDRLVALAATIEREGPAPKDMFAPERRVERRFPDLAQALPHFIQGYEHSAESARAILTFLEQHFTVNRALAEAIREMADKAG
ncbi:MAG TPA: hypothetical protein VJ020_02790 [Anaerolineales bacterium]|nr:hypothetical protein [Anaerolineales bacterium]